MASSCPLIALLMVFYRFARKAALMVYKLFDKGSVTEKKALLRRSEVTPIQLLGDKGKADIDTQMKAKFVEFDANNDGTVLYSSLLTS
jgi:hypothetical protein